MWISIAKKIFNGEPHHCNTPDFEESRYQSLFCHHGGTGDGATFRGQLEIGTTIGEEVILPFPDGLNGLWNAGGAFDALTSSKDDVGRIMALIDEMVTTNRIDETKIDLCGHSLGSMLVYRLLIEHPTRFRRAVCFSGVPLVVNNGAFTGDILHIHGALDVNIPIAGGVGINGFTYPPLYSTMAQFSNANITFVIPPTGEHTMSSLRTAIINDLGTTSQQLMSDFLMGA